MDDDTIWEQNRYDSGLYGCKVVKKGEGGVLTVSLLSHPGFRYAIHRETVNFVNVDRDKWRKRCEAVISDPDLRTIAA